MTRRRPARRRGRTSLTARRSDVTFKGDIKPDELIAVHEPWHQAYYYIKDNPTQDMDWVLSDDSEAIAPYRKAMELIKSEKLGEAFNPAEPRDAGGKWVSGPDTRGWVDVAFGRGDDWPAPSGAKPIAGTGLPEGMQMQIRGGAVFATLDGEDLGVLLTGGPVSARRVEGLAVRSDVRRRGIASAMLVRAREEWGKVEHDLPERRTEMGAAFARGMPRLVEAYVETLHPRGRTGQWVKKAIAAAGVKGVDVRRAFGYGDASPTSAKRSDYRRRATEAILESGTAIRDAVMLLPPDTVRREELLKKLAVGDTKRAMKEYSETPVGDLEVLSGIYVKTHPVPGQANAQMASRTLTMGSTSVTGDFRHELGHAIRSSFGGAGGHTAKTPLTTYVAARHSETLARRDASSKAGLPKPKTHQEWEERIGVIDPRGLDNWDEDFAEQYRAYQKAVFQVRHPEVGDYNPDALETYRKRFPKWSALWDAWYTAQLAGRFEEPSVQKSLAEADVLLEAYERRYPRGTREGGRFMPRVGATPHLSLLKRHMLSSLFPELPTVPRGAKRKGEHHVLAGQRVFVPKERVFRRELDGRVFHSPAGSTSVYTTPAPMLGGGGENRLLPPSLRRHLHPGQDVPIEDLERVRGEENTSIDAAIAHALEAHDRNAPPAIVGNVGYMTDARLRDSGFLQIDNDTSNDTVSFDYLAPDGVSLLKVSYDKQGAAVKLVSWEPREVEHKRQLTRPPQTFLEFADDLYAYAHDEGQRLGVTATVGQISAEPPEKNSDHTGIHHWNGDIELGSDVPQNIFEAAVARKRNGTLTPKQMEGVWAATQAGVHEAIHGINPTPIEVYGDGPNMVLEEAMTEELSNVETVKKLLAQGQDDVVQWAANNPTNVKRLGTYAAYRHALAFVLNAAGVEPQDREQFLRNLKFGIPPGERIPMLCRLRVAQRGRRRGRRGARRGVGDGDSQPHGSPVRHRPDRRLRFRPDPRDTSGPVAVGRQVHAGRRQGRAGRRYPHDQVEAGS